MIDREALLITARAAARHAYVPYSRFHVGAAVLCADGTVVPGANVENASFGLAMCAERSALFAAVGSGQVPGRDLLAVAVTCPDGDPTDVASHMPCGACRQCLVELLVVDGVVILDGVGTFRPAELLPDAFRIEPPK
jgi:cytidine deaminase